MRYPANEETGRQTDIRTKTKKQSQCRR